MRHLLLVDQLKVWYNTPYGKVSAVDDVSFYLEEGETFALLGETGCGKSTIGRTVMGLPGDNAVISGSVYFKGKNLLKLSERELAQVRGNEMTIILQNPELALNPVLPIGSQLVEPLKLHRKLSHAQAIEAVRSIMSQMGFPCIDDILKKYPFQLSGGMNQRILIAAALLMNPALIVADEPTRGLDEELKDSIKKILASAQSEGNMAMILITHDLDLAVDLADRAAVMYAGQLVEINPIKSIVEKPLHPYSEALVNSRKQIAFNRETDLPSLQRLPATGCRYAPRCPYKMEQCLTIEPMPVFIDGGEVKCLKYY